VSTPPAHRGSRSRVLVRPTTPADFAGIIALTARTYPGSPPWSPAQLASHLAHFPEGQLVAVDRTTGEVVGMAASRIVLWDDYDFDAPWRDFTADGAFANHDPVHGRTLYGAEGMVDPSRRGHGIGTTLYAARSCRASASDASAPARACAAATASHIASPPSSTCCASCRDSAAIQRSASSCVRASRCSASRRAISGTIRSHSAGPP
jgi:ribosomal protein S18 acetylase RimI-like enzyme